MATLTYDPTPADQPEFNEAEQEALAIGEAAEQEQSAAYAGKFKDAEELERAYIELQKKLGANETDTDAEEAGSQDEQLQEEEKEVSPAAELINSAAQMYGETGELTPEVLEQFNSMSSADLVNAYMEMQGNIGSQSSPDLTDAEVNSIINRIEVGEEAPRPKTMFEPGEVIRVCDGPFNDFNGVVEEVDYERNSVKVSVQILGRSTSVQLNFMQIEKT